MITDAHTFNTYPSWPRTKLQQDIDLLLKEVTSLYGGDSDLLSYERVIVEIDVDRVLKRSKKSKDQDFIYEESRITDTVEKSEENFLTQGDSPYKRRAVTVFRPFKSMSFMTRHVYEEVSLFVKKLEF